MTLHILHPWPWWCWIRLCWRILIRTSSRNVRFLFWCTAGYLETPGMWKSLPDAAEPHHDELSAWASTTGSGCSSSKTKHFCLLDRVHALKIICWLTGLPSHRSELSYWAPCQTRSISSLSDLIRPAGVTSSGGCSKQGFCSAWGWNLACSHLWT